MKAELVKKLLTSKQINLEDLNNFIVDYVYFKKNKHVTTEELAGISTLIQRRVFNLRYALITAANHFGLTVMTAADKNGVILHTNVY